MRGNTRSELGSRKRKSKLVVVFRRRNVKARRTSDFSLS